MSGLTGYQIVLGDWQGRAVAALLLQGQLEDLLLAPDDDTPLPGAIYRAKVNRPMKGQGGAMLDLGDGQTGWLRQSKGLKPGTTFLVQVTGHAEPGKAAPVTPRILFKSRYGIVTPHAPGINISRQIREEEDRERLAAVAHQIELEPGHGAILRSAAAEADDAAVGDDLAAMADLAAKIMGDEAGEPALLLEGPDPEELAWRDWPRPDEVAHDEEAFERFEIAEMIDGLRSPFVALEGGATMYVEPTRALVAVDVNTGGDTSPAAGLKANIAAARALPRALRLRGLSGQLVLDLAPMPKKDRNRWEQVLKSALKADPIETRLIGWTPLGHAELQRKRERPALADLFR